MKNELLRIKHLKKTYAANHILIDINLNLYRGEVIGIMGLHNSGKTVLSNIIAGNETFTDGLIYFDEEPASFKELSDTNKIFMIHKHSSLINSLSVMENIFILRKHKNKRFLVHRRLIKKQLILYFNDLEINILPTEKVANLSKIQCYIIEVVKAYILGAKVIIIEDIMFDNTDGEYQELYKIIDKFKNKGIAFILTSYDIRNLQVFSDRIFFLSGGIIMKSIRNTERNLINIEKLLIDQQLGIRDPKKKNNITKEILISFKNVSTDYLTDISFQISKGEIIVFFDLYNNSNNALLEVFRNNQQKKAGDIYIKGMNFDNPNKIDSSNIIFADFNTENNIFECLSVAENLCLGNYNKLSSFGFLRKRRIQFIEKDFINEYGNNELIKKKHCFNLSENEKISIYLYRLSLQKDKIILCINPEAIADSVTYKLIEDQFLKMANNGMTIVVFTSNLGRICNLANRFTIMYNGKIQNTFATNEFNEFF